jgi:hypothetical protein
MKIFAILTLSQLIACGTKIPAEKVEPTETVEDVASTQNNAEEKSDKSDNISIEDLEHFGNEFTVENAIPAATVLSNPDSYVDKTVRITGTVSDVCQKMGCWMVITDADQHMRITTKEHKFFVAKDGAGATCDLEGTVVKQEANPERTEHFKSEQSDGAPIPEAELAGKATYEIVASAIRFDRSNMPTTTPSATTKEENASE